MYQGFYRLREDPFRLTPDPAFIYMTAQHREALAGLVYSVCTRPGLAVLTGEAGTGKTTLLYALLDMLEKRRFVTALCTNPTLTREEFFDLLILKFRIECSSSLKSRQLAALHDTLLRNRADGRPSVLIVDEAQRLPLELLEEIRLLLNVETPREKLLQIIVAGQPELSQVLHRPELRQLKQRVSCLCKLDPLNHAELKEYVDHRLARAGMPQQTLFSQAVIERLYDYTEGIPRLVNSLCNTALQTGFALRSPQMTAAIIDEAAKDLDLIRTGVDRATADESSTAATPPKIRPAADHVADNNGRNGNGRCDQIPLESYVTRQKSLNFFSNLMGLWK